MKDIFLCSTFTSDWNLSFNPKLCDALEKRSITCYSPKRDTNQEGTPQGKFEQNTEAIKNAKVLLYISIHETPNGGGEVGFAYGIGKKIIVLTKKRHKTPLMLKGMVDTTLEVDDLDNIENYIDDLIEKIKQ
ncbi:MAG: hypothetical protein HQ538_07155 [Parcubacteria group bacterium]|nr:hypothetical protein [Parcubacteria group bacterium]